MKWAIAFTALGVIDGLLRLRERPPIWTVDLPLGLRGACIPGVGVLIDPAHANDPRVVAHELCHWDQYRRMGFTVFVLIYAIELALNGYGGSRMEIECRRMSGESDYCTYNYRKCYPAS